MPDDNEHPAAKPPISSGKKRPHVSADAPIAISPEILARYHARILEPANAARASDQPAPQSTVYVPDQVIVSGAAEQAVRTDLTSAANALKIDLVPPVEHEQHRAGLVQLALDAGHDDAETRFATIHQLLPQKGFVRTPDAWELLQAVRSGRDFDRPVHEQVGLNHLLTAARFVHGSPVPGSSSYGLAGSGGRQPVSWLGAEPVRRREDAMPCRRPVVAVLDTGVGGHPWFHTGLERNATFNGTRIGMPEKLYDAEALGRADDELGGALDADTGHGTFIAGLIRQLCPDANILSVRVMHSDGIVPEHVLLEALTLLALRQKTAQRDNDPGSIIDIVSLSLGYYHELPVEERLDTPLHRVLRELSELGVLVVAAAGNDATTRPMYPAAFAPHRDASPDLLDAGCPPVLAVGAQNPNLTTAMFSNEGPWVTVERPGASLVSTFPTAVDGPAEPDRRLDADGKVREDPDPDDFAAGFAVWSGTSFAAPVFAAELANTLLGGSCGNLDEIDGSKSVTRAWDVVERHTRLRRPHLAVLSD